MVADLASIPTADLLALRAVALKYNEAEARVPAGSGRESGEWGGGGDVTAAEKQVVHAYQSSFGAVQFIQTHPKSPDARTFAAAVAKCPPVSGKVYRAVDEIRPHHGGAMTQSEAKALWEGRVGQTVSMHDPVSTATSVKAALDYGNVLFQIDPVAGAARDISGISKFPNYPEAILAPGDYRVTQVADGPPRTQTSFGPLGSPSSTTLVFLQDVTAGDRQFYSDRSGADARTTTVKQANDLRRFIAVPGQPGGFDLECSPADLVKYIAEPKAVRLSSGGPRRDASLDPIIARVKAQLIALAAETSNRDVVK